MRIAEIFYSIQGEGKLTGAPSVFVRVSGCNLRCTWCDTPYASWQPEGPEMDVAAIVAKVEKQGGWNEVPDGPEGATAGAMGRGGGRYVVLTGGEPLMMREIVPLMHQLKERGCHITVETAGTLWPEGLAGGGGGGREGAGSIDLASISPKLANSTPWEREGGRFARAHEAQRENLAVLRSFAMGGEGTVLERQWKFVIAQPRDVEEMEGLIGRINEGLSEQHRIRPVDVLLMPEARDAETLTVRSRELAEICKRRGYRLSPRLHVYLWGNRRGT